MAIQAKGSAFEREVAVKLSQWVSGGRRKDVFWRTAMSGGRATVFRKKGSLYRQSGDICAVSLEGHTLTDCIYFELKFYADLELPSFFLRGKGCLSKFWAKAKEEAKFYHLKPVLIVKQNRGPVLWLCERAQVPKAWLRYTNNWAIHVEHHRCSIYKFDDVLASPYIPLVPRLKLEN